MKTNKKKHYFSYSISHYLGLMGAILFLSTSLQAQQFQYASLNPQMKGNEAIVSGNTLTHNAGWQYAGVLADIPILAPSQWEAHISGGASSINIGLASAVRYDLNQGVGTTGSWAVMTSYSPDQYFNDNAATGSLNLDSTAGATLAFRFDPATGIFEVSADGIAWEVVSTGITEEVFAAGSLRNAADAIAFNFGPALTLPVSAGYRAGIYHAYAELDATTKGVEAIVSGNLLGHDTGWSYAGALSDTPIRVPSQWEVTVTGLNSNVDVGVASRTRYDVNQGLGSAGSWALMSTYAPDRYMLDGGANGSLTMDAVNGSTIAFRYDPTLGLLEVSADGVIWETVASGIAEEVYAAGSTRNSGDSILFNFGPALTLPISSGYLSGLVDVPATGAGGGGTSGGTGGGGSGSGFYPESYGQPGSCGCPSNGGQEFHVGPGQAYANLGDVDWAGLVAGDTVYIHHRAEPYHEKIALRAHGTEALPVRICGVPGGNGELPIIDGANATTRPDLINVFHYWNNGTETDETRGVIYLRDKTWGQRPQNIEIKNLHLRGAHPDNSFTSTSGATLAYEDGAAGIYVNGMVNLTVSCNELERNGNGFFAMSKDDEAEVSRNIKVSNNFIHHNGVAGSFRQHNVYTGAAGILFEYNLIGRLADGAEGSALKDRSSGTIIRYNWIESGARLLDLVDTEDSPNVVALEPDYHQAHAYGNVLINDVNFAPYSRAMIHWGGDSGVPTNYRQGPLYFYNNTVAILGADASRAAYMRLFEQSTNDQMVDMRNNIVHLEGNSTLYLLHGYGQLAMDKNWITPGWNTIHYPGLGGSVIQNGVILSDGNCLPNASSYDFTLAPGSSCVDGASTLPMEFQPVTQMYKTHFQGESRAVVGGAADLGALESPAN